MSRLAVYGASGHGKVVADIAHRNGYKEIIFIDDGDNEYMDFETFTKNFTTILHIALGIGDNQTREKVYEKVQKAGYEVITLVDPSAIIAPTVQIDNAAVIMPGVIINADVSIGRAAIINSGAIIEHDCKVDAYSHISPNVALAGGVKVSKSSHVGIGSCVIQNVHIGENAIVGAGTVVINNVTDNSIVAGNPAKCIKENHA
jgi:UDP-N-acetylbacillosamine N-acetyltransferase